MVFVVEVVNLFAPLLITDNDMAVWILIAFLQYLREIFRLKPIVIYDQRVIFGHKG